jgi:hypothetical protein
VPLRQVAGAMCSREGQSPDVSCRTSCGLRRSRPRGGARRHGRGSVAALRPTTSEPGGAVAWGKTLQCIH